MRTDWWSDCTAEQLQQASLFLAARGWPKVVPATMPRREDIVRLLACYGALRDADPTTAGQSRFEWEGRKESDREESA